LRISGYVRFEAEEGGLIWRHIFEDSPLSDVTPHVLRHSFASIANDLGFTEVTIAALVGHAKGSVTSRPVSRSPYPCSIAR
jgi:integrase